MRRLLPMCALWLSACGLLDAVTPDNPRGTLLQNRVRWQMLAIRDYDFDYQLTCFCGQEAIEPVRIEVRGDSVNRVLSRRTGAVIAASPQFITWPTIDSLFDWTERAFDQRYRLEINYDAAHFFPTYVSGDIPMAADDEFLRTAGNLARR